VQATDGSHIAAWFGGTCEGHPDVGIWRSRLTGSGWSYPEEIVDTQTTDGSVGSAFNPVLFQYPQGPTLLFYLSGPLGTAVGNLRVSHDGGLTWSQEQRLPGDTRGATKNKPVLLDDGTLICPDNSSTLTFHRTRDYGKTWLKTGAAPDPQKLGAIQPTILTHPGGRLQALGRSQCGSVVMTWSDDGGETWTPLERTDVPNNNSGLDAVTLKDGRHVLVCNPVPIPEGRWGGPRTPLSVLISDDGLDWKLAVTLEDEPGEYSYPSVIQSDDGLVHVVYTWHRLRVKHAVLDPELFEPKGLD
jgi:predicted neuraminidase